MTYQNHLLVYAVYCMKIVPEPSALENHFFNLCCILYENFSRTVSTGESFFNVCCILYENCSRTVSTRESHFTLCCISYENFSRTVSTGDSIFNLWCILYENCSVTPSAGIGHWCGKYRARVWTVSTNFHGRQDCVTCRHICNRIWQQMAALDGFTTELIDKSWLKFINKISCPFC